MSVAAVVDPSDKADVVVAEVEAPKKPNSAGVRGMLHYADWIDYLCSVLASFFFTAFGVSMVSFLFFLKPFFTDISAAESSGGGVAMSTINVMASSLCFLAAGQFLVVFPGMAVANVSAARQKREWQKGVVQSILRQEVGWFDTSKPEELTSKVGSSVALITRGLEGPSYGMFVAVGGIVTGLVGGFLESYQISLVVLAMVPLLGVAIAILVCTMVTGSKAQSKAYGTAGGYASEALFAMRTVAALGLEAEFVNKYASNLAKARNVTVSGRAKLGLATGLLFSSFILLQGVGFMYGGITFADELKRSSYDYVVNQTFAVPVPGMPGVTFDVTSEVHYCAYANNTPANVSFNEPCEAPLKPLQMNCQLANLFEMFDKANMTAFGTNMSMLEVIGQDSWDDLRNYSRKRAPEYSEENSSYWACSLDGAIIVITVMFVMQGAMGIGQAAQPIQQISAAIPASDAMLSIVSRVSAIDSFDQGGRKLESVRGEIVVKDVIFAYPAAPDFLVCNGYSLSIPSGQTVALSGASGSGKSTIIQLIERFYDPVSGSITLDGVDIKTLNVRWLRDQLGLVSQEPVLFQGTVAENIMYGKRDATHEEVEEAAKNANAHGFIMESLNDGYQTQVGQMGSKLSGGQKQRVAIARALVKKPAVLLLDEATSALDNESERIVQAALDEIMTKMKRTTIVIAHRLSTIRNADKIAVVEKGQVVEEGTYQELIDRGEGGFFYKLAHKQQQMGAMDLKKMDTAMKLKAESGHSGHNLDSLAPPDEETPNRRKGRFSREKRTSKEGSSPNRKKRGSKEAVEEGKEDATTDKKGAKKKTEKPPIGRLWMLNKDALPYVAVGMVFALGSGGLPLYAFYNMLSLFTVFFQVDGETIREESIYYSSVLFATIGGVIFCFWADTFCFGVFAARLTYKLRQKGFNAFVGQEIGFFDTESHSAGALTSFLSEKATVIEFLTGGQLQAMLRALAALAGILSFSAIFGAWQILLYMLAAFPLMMAIMGTIMMIAAGDQIRAQQGKEQTGKAAMANKEAGQLIGEVVMAIRTVASFNAEHQFVKDYNAKVDRVKQLDTKDGVKAGFAAAVGMSLFMLVMAGMNYYGGYLISEKLITFEEMMTPMFMMMGGMMIITAAFLGLKDPATATAAAKLFFEAIDSKPKIDVLADEGVKLESVRGDIEVKDVIFAYPTAPDHLVCKGYTVSISAGQTVALSGASGSGKSTIIQLLERFYDPQGGSITLDGVNISTLNVKWLRQQLGLVSQEPVLFQGTVAENIMYGKRDATREEVEEAAKNANAHGFIMESLQSGYETDVGMRGSKLSGGQKQRVAIARALVRKPSVLLLDEATSALDNESERIVQAALDEIMTKMKRTTIVIAHRLSTIRNADKIVVLKEGQVAEEGTHDELLSNTEGLYFNLVLAQQ